MHFLSYVNRLNKLAKTISLLFIFLLLSSCARTQIQVQGAAFNQAIASFEYKQILSNVVRASLGLPVTITSLSQISGEEMFSGKFTPELPFGVDADGIYRIGPTINFGPGIGSAAYNNMTISPSLKTLNEPLSLNVWMRFARHGYSPPLLGSILFNRIMLHESMVLALVNNYISKCSEPDDNDEKQLCDEYRRIADHCDFDLNYESDFTELENGQRYINITNTGRSACEFKIFELVNILFVLAELTVDSLKKDISSELALDKNNPSLVNRPIESIKPYFQVKSVQEIYENTEYHLKKYKANPSPPAITIGVRSPIEVVEYLGRLAALERDGTEKIKATLRTETGYAHIIKLQSGSGVGANIAVSTRGEDGNIYYIRFANKNTTRHDLSIQSLTLAINIVNTALSAHELPSSTHVIFRSD